MTPHHGHYNIDPIHYHRAAQRSLFYRAFHSLPMQTRVPLGVVATMAAGYLSYVIVRPSQKNRPVHTLTPEWEAANEAYAEAQNINPIRRYKEAAY